jgi:hypothetical protein
MPKFVYRLEREGDRSLIYSECVHCHASRVVSVADGSLKEWETSHRCREPIESSPSAAQSSRKITPFPSNGEECG